jgi:DNA-binding NtrC family response regulator
MSFSAAESRRDNQSDEAPPPGTWIENRGTPRSLHGKGGTVKQQLESLVDEMVDRGIEFTDARREFEKKFIARVLQRNDGNLSRSAQDLRIHRNTLGKKIEEYKLKRVGRA